MAHLFQSVHEQTYVAYVISYAARIGPFQNLTAASDQLHINETYVFLLIVILFIISI